MKKLAVFTIACIGAVSEASAQTPQNMQQGFVATPVTLGKTVNGWTEVSNGLQMRIWKDAAGTPPTIGDFIQLHIRARVGDSVLFSTRQVNNNEPIEIQVVPPQQPQYDMMQAFTLLTAGDSATFRMPIDSAWKLGVPKSDWMKSGTSFDQDVVMVKQTSQADAFKEKAEKSKKQAETDEKLIKDYLTKNKITATKHPSGLYYQILQKGTGDTARAGQKVTVNYTGQTIEGKVFDSNVDPKFQHVQPFSFTLGQGQVISGWDVGVGMLKKGAKAKLFIPSQMAYGERSPSPDIPKNGILIFDVEVSNIEAGEAPAQHGPGDGHNH